MAKIWTSIIITSRAKQQLGWNSFLTVGDSSLENKLFFLIYQQMILTKCVLISDRHQCCQLLQVCNVHDNQVVTIVIQRYIGIFEDKI
jgi:hypothetical protein